MKKIIFIAYSLNPTLGSEAGRASAWLDIITKYYYAEVITDAISKDTVMAHYYNNSSFHFVIGTLFWRRLGRYIGISNLATKIFFYRAKKILKNINLENVSLIHCITPAGVHSYNDFYKFPTKLLIGPLGGALPTPKGFKEAFRFQKKKTFLRDMYYYLYLKTNSKFKRYLMKADMIILGTSLHQSSLPDNIKSKSIRIPDALVDTSYFHPSDTVKTDLIRILFAGRLTGSKGPLLLLDAVRKCSIECSTPFIVEIAGKGELEQTIKNYIYEHNLGKKIILLGSLTKDQLLKKYQHSDIFCLPTLREPGGIAILEAMACGLPVISTDYGGPSVILTNECGIKIPLTEYSTYVSDLSQAIIHMMSNPALRKTMGEKGRSRAIESYSIIALENKIVKLYSDLHKD